MDGVSLEVGEGEIYELLGPNGAGKTTTLSMICGLLKPDAGEVTIQGRGFWSDPLRPALDGSRSPGYRAV